MTDIVVCDSARAKKALECIEEMAEYFKLSREEDWSDDAEAAHHFLKKYGFEK